MPKACLLGSEGVSSKVRSINKAPMILGLVDILRNLLLLTYKLVLLDNVMSRTWVGKVHDLSYVLKGLFARF